MTSDHAFTSNCLRGDTTRDTLRNPETTANSHANSAASLQEAQRHAGAFVNEKPLGACGCCLTDGRARQCDFDHGRNKPCTPCRPAVAAGGDSQACDRPSVTVFRKAVDRVFTGHDEAYDLRPASIPHGSFQIDHRPSATAVTASATVAVDAASSNDDPRHLQRPLSPRRNAVPVDDDASAQLDAPATAAPQQPALSKSQRKRKANKAVVVPHYHQSSHSSLEIKLLQLGYRWSTKRT